MQASTRIRIGGYGAAGLLVATAVFSNQVLDDGKFSWGWLIAALAVAGAAEGWNHWRAQPAPSGQLRLTDAAGRPPRLDEIDLYQLGVHRSRFAEADTSPPHIPRSCDAKLAAALTRLDEPGTPRLIVVEGERLAGTSHTLAHALRSHLPTWRLAAFTDDPTVRLSDLITQALDWAEPEAGVVLWLDAIGTDRLGELTAPLLEALTQARLAAVPKHLLIAVTVHQQVTSPDGEKPLRLAGHVRELLRERALHLVVGTLTADERARLSAEPAYDRLRPLLDDAARELVMGRLMVTLDQLRHALTPGTGEQAADRIALLRAATDWQRAQVPARLTAKALQRLWKAYRRQISNLPKRTRLPTDAFTRALAWASAPATAARPQLIDFGPFYWPHPLLAVVAEEPEPVGWPISPALWDYAEAHLEAGQRYTLAATAVDRGDLPGADRLLRSIPAAMVAASTAYALARRLHINGSLSAARHWYLHIIELDRPDESPRVMVGLGILEQQQGDIGQARTWFTRAVESGHPDQAPRAMVDLGILEYGQGDIGQAHTWFTRAVESGHPDWAPDAMVNLGVLEEELGDIGQARTWYTRTIASDHPDHAPAAMVGLGVLEKKQGDIGQARTWFTRAVESGHPDQAPKAMVNLGVLEYEQGRLEQARSWYTRTIASDHPDHAPAAMVNLGILEKKQGDIGQARTWFTRAVESGYPDQAPKAMVSLGVLEKKQGDIDQARTWFTRAVESGHPDHAPAAMVNLGILEKNQGDIGQARTWYARTIESDHPDQAPSAMLNLGVLEYEQGDIGQARTWFTRAVESGHPDKAPKVMVNLGILEEEQGRLEQARTWYTRAIVSGHPEHGPDAQRRLKALQLWQAEQRRAIWEARYGRRPLDD
ncbi:tetratricopeptide repeat protein [Planobispora rosea]|uniref:tetratricopeptide repeat protein n=1 Tax=Planobispora rosea TaxID=35762 RepID=UPI00083B4DB9|nr:tetratricopeptide repeat protein [Planobispora rosea]